MKINFMHSLKKSAVKSAMVIFSAAFLTAAVSCSKDPLNGKWQEVTGDPEGGTIVTFNTKDQTISLSYGENKADGTYSFADMYKFNVHINTWKEGNMNYSDVYSQMEGLIQMATLSMQEDGSLMFRDFFYSPLYLTGGTGTSVEEAEGEWSLTDETENATFTLTLNKDGTFRMTEYAPGYEEADENGYVLEAEGIYETEKYQDITLSVNANGNEQELYGEFTMSEDKNTMSIDEVDFKRIK